MRYSLRSSLALVALLVALGAASVGAAPAPTPGNSEAAKLCQDGGYANYTRPDGTPFRGPGECVQYAAQGGLLRPPLAPLALALGPVGGRGTYLVLLTGYTLGQTFCVQKVDEVGTIYEPPIQPSCFDGGSRRWGGVR